MGSDTARQLAVDRLNAVRREIAKVIVGQDDVVEGVLICLLASGHVLLEGVPGLGKTTLLRTLARTLNLKYSRIQFTPDLMPADIVGSMIIETGERGAKQLRFQPGPDFRQPGAGRRNQPRHAQNPIRAARGHAGAHRDQRHQHPSARSAFPGDGHPEPHRDGRHLSSARSAARPLPDEDSGDLPDARGAEPHRRAHHSAGRTCPRSGAGSRRHPGSALGVPAGDGRAARSGIRH